MDTNSTQIINEELTSYRVKTNPPFYMNPIEASTYTGISRRKLDIDTKKGFFKFIRLGGRIIYRREDIDKALEDLVS